MSAGHIGIATGHIGISEVLDWAPARPDEPGVFRCTCVPVSEIPKAMLEHDPIVEICNVLRRLSPDIDTPDMLDPLNYADEDEDKNNQENEDSLP